MGKQGSLERGQAALLLAIVVLIVQARRSWVGAKRGGWGRELAGDGPEEAEQG